MRKRNVTRFAKKCLAYSLATVTIATSALGGLTFMQEPVVVEAATADMLSNQERGVIYANSRTDFRDESIYFLITTRFYDGDTSNNARTSEDDNKAHNPEHDPSWRGDFKGLIDKLDYIKALGFTAIWITPVVQNDSGYDYHGYHAYNFSAVDTRYESNGVTYQTLIDAVHAKGMKIIQDVVLNHTCNWGEENLLKITSDIYAERNQVVMNGKGDSENIYHHNGFCGGGDWDEYAAQDKTIADDCFDLETENPKVYNYLVDCYQKYINMGVDGFRIDTVKHISRLTFNTVFLPAFKEDGGEDFYMFGEVCTKGHDVWYRGNPPISTCFYTWDDTDAWKSQWSDSLASNEALVQKHYMDLKDTSKQPTSDNAFLKGNEYHTPDYSMKSGMDVIDFQMHWAFNDANQAYRTALGQDRYFNDSTWNVVYVDSHDYAPDQSQTTRYTGGTTKWAENLSLMFTFRGIPCIYYGSEIEFQAGKPIDVGPMQPLSATGRAYFGDHIEGTVDTTDFTVFGNLSGEVKETLNSTLSQHIMRLNRLRQAIPALRKGQYSTEGCDGNMAFKRRYTDSTTDSFVLVTISGNATFSGIPNGKYVDAVTGDIQNVTNGTLTASVSGQGNMKVYVLDTAKTPAPGRVIPNGDYLNDGGKAELIGEDLGPIVEVTGIKTNTSSVTVMQGQKETVTATVEPSNATNKTVKWTSSDSSVATVSGGVITGVGVGTATITAKTYNGKTATVKVTVTKDPNYVDVTGVKLSPTSTEVEVKSTVNLTATVSPSNATNKTVIWSSSDDKVATVSNGVVTGVSAGTAVITVKTVDGGFSATTTVTVTGKAVPIIENGVYFEKPSGWGSTIYAYAWSGNTEHFGAWSGKAMEDLGNGLYGISCDFDEANTKIIFNDGANQTSDLAFKKNGYYTSSGLDHIVDPVQTGTVVVKCEDENGNVLSTKTMTGKVGDSYTTTAETFDGYTLKTTPSNATGKYASSTITVTYVYKKESKPINELTVTAKTSTSSVKVGDTVKITATATSGYDTYTYIVYKYDSATSSWKKLTTSSATSNNTYSYTWTADKAGTSKFKVEVSAKGVDGSATSSAVSVTVEQGIVNVLTGLCKASDGKWYYYTNGKVDTSFTGMAKNANGWWYVKAGKLDLTYTGMAKNANGWWYMKNGKLDLTYTGMATNANGTWYMKNGKLDTSVSGLIKTNIGWVYLTKGQLDTDFIGMVKNAGIWWYVNKGKIDTTYTGLAKNSNGTWYMKNGKLDTSVSGFIKAGSVWVYLKAGKVDTTYTGMAKNSNGWWYVKNGQLDLTYTGMAKNSNGWWYMKKGKLDLTYTGMATNSVGTWYMNKGKLDTTYTGMVKTEKGWVYVTKGQLDTKYTGMAKNKYGWWYIEKGQLETSYTGLVKHNNKFVYVQRGKLDTAYTGLVKFGSNWVYVKSGLLDSTFTGISSNQYGWWYVKGGKVDLTYTGKVTYNKVTYHVIDGAVLR